VLAVGHDDEARFLALQEFLDHHSAPAAPKRPANMAVAASIGFGREAAMITPLPAARPLALTTIGGGCARTQAGSKLSRVKVR
jgi:hypothetical protein